MIVNEKFAVVGDGIFSIIYIYIYIYIYICVCVCVWIHFSIPQQCWSVIQGWFYAESPQKASVHRASANNSSTSTSFLLNSCVRW